MRKLLKWNAEKDAWLRRARGFGFEEIYEAINDGGLIADTENPSQNHTDQRMLVVRLNGYLISVPYVEDGEVAFLKTAYPNRKLRRRYGKDTG